MLTEASQMAGLIRSTFLSTVMTPVHLALHEHPYLFTFIRKETLARAGYVHLKQRGRDHSPFGHQTQATSHEPEFVSGRHACAPPQFATIPSQVSTSCLTLVWPKQR